MSTPRRYSLTLAVYLSRRGFAFVLFEGQLSPLDWGVKELRGLRRGAHCFARLRALITTYRPDAVVLQDTSEHGTKRIRRIRALNEQIAALARAEGAVVKNYSRQEVRAVFGPLNAETKDEIARVIAASLPALGRFVPSVRKPWMSEDRRMGIFDAAALAITFFQSEADAAR